MEMDSYVHAANARRESDVLRRLRERTATLPEAQMQISVEQGRLIALLTELVGARRALEVGTFTGYSALCIAERLPADGLLVCCDVSAEWTAIAREFWREAAVLERVDLRLGPATETLAALLAAGEEGSFDLAFIDADKEGYLGYVEACLALLRPGGLLLVDNMFLGGRVLTPEVDDAAAKVVRDVAERAFADPRLDPVLVPIRDGLLVARKREPSAHAE